MRCHCLATLDKHLGFDVMIYTVAVRSNKLKPLNSTLALGFCFRVLTEGRAKWLFLCPFTITAPLAILSAHVCGSEGGKRISLTQGGRLRECCTTSDKRLDRLIGCCRDKFSGSINKAVHINKGQTPLITTPQG